MLRMCGYSISPLLYKMYVNGGSKVAQPSNLKRTKYVLPLLVKPRCSGKQRPAQAGGCLELPACNGLPCGVLKHSSWLAEEVSDLRYDVTNLTSSIGISEEKLTTFFQWFAQSPTAITLFCQGLSILKRPRQIGTELSHDVLNPARVPL